MHATITTKGQLTMPKAVREKLGVEPGDKVDFRETETGDFIVSAVERVTLDGLIGCLSHLADGPPISAEERRAAIGDMLAEDDARIRREASE